jgi:hypothetical protein
LIFLLPKLQSLDRLATFIFSFELGEKILFWIGKGMNSIY